MKSSFLPKQLPYYQKSSSASSVHPGLARCIVKSVERFRAYITSVFASSVIVHNRLSLQALLRFSRLHHWCNLVNLFNLTITTTTTTKTRRPFRSYHSTSVSPFFSPHSNRFWEKTSKKTSSRLCDRKLQEQIEV